ncbi:MAG: DUF4349 domain-containing protein [Lacisediminihabitans sp.]
MRRLMIPAVLVLAALTLAGCTASNGSSSDSAVRAPVADSGTNLVKGKAQEPNADPSGVRQVIKTGSMTMTVKSPADAADKVADIVESAGGYLDSRTEHKAEDADGGSAQLTVRIPSARLTATIDSIKKVGTLEDIEISSSDVTSQSQDLDARISALHTSVDRLQALMAKATSTQDLITIESALSERQGNLEAMESQKRDLENQVDLSTISVTLNSASTAKTQLPGNFFDGIITGWTALVGFFAGLVVVVGVLLPWLILGAAIAAGVLAVIRWRRKRTVRSKGDSAS